MNYSTRETMELHEILGDSACMIDHFTDYINHCQDQALKQILEKQQKQMIDNYQRKVGIMQGHGFDMSKAPGFLTTAGQFQGQQPGSINTRTIQQGMPQGTGIQFGSQQHQQAHSQAHGHGMEAAGKTFMNDMTISRGALMFHKCGAVRTTNAALEMSEPHLRTILADSARMCQEMAYECFMYMHQKGYYQLPDAPGNYVSHMDTGSTYGRQQQYFSPQTAGFPQGPGHVYSSPQGYPQANPPGHTQQGAHGSSPGTTPGSVPGNMPGQFS